MFPHGVNVEFVSPVRDGRVAMRVHERGVGETRSCGTGTVAAVVAALRAAGETTGDVEVDTPGGRLRVTVGDDTTVLHGPAVLVASGELDPDWWDGGTRPSPSHDRIDRAEPPGLVPSRRSRDSDRNPRDAAGVVVEVCLPR